MQPHALGRRGIESFDKSNRGISQASVASMRAEFLRETAIGSSFTATSTGPSMSMCGMVEVRQFLRWHGV